MFTNLIGYRNKQMSAFFGNMMEQNWKHPNMPYKYTLKCSQIYY